MGNKVSGGIAWALIISVMSSSCDRSVAYRYDFHDYYLFSWTPWWICIGRNIHCSPT